MSVKQRAERAGEFAREQAEAARLAASETIANARSNAAALGRRTGDGLNAAPLIALAGGLAVGALLAALLPRSDKERELLGGVGERLSDGARNAAEAARQAGQAKLDELGLTRDAAANSIRTLLAGAGDAARSSAEAAIGAVRERR